MKRKIDIKSVAFGMFLGIGVFALVGADRSKSIELDTPPPRNATEGTGRFQVVMGQRHCFVLDTITGRVWQKHLLQKKPDTSQDFYKDKR